MSLYTDIAKSLSTQGIQTGIGDAIGSAQNGIAQALGGSTFANAVAGAATSVARNAAVGLANKYIPGHLQKIVTAGTGAIGDIMNGDFSNAGLRVFDSGLLDGILPGMSGIAAQARYFGTPTPLMGGITPAEAKRIHDEMHHTRYCKKNLWLIEVGGALGDVSNRFNLFATGLEYSPFTLSGEKRRIGAAHADILNSSDPVEMSITTLDDDSGFIKAWFEAHAAMAANGDGTVGVPASYAIKIKVVHGFVSKGMFGGNGYQNIGLFRPANISFGLDRREDGLSEVQMTFAQLDTFVDPGTVS